VKILDSPDKIDSKNMHKLNNSNKLRSFSNDKENKWNLDNSTTYFDSNASLPYNKANGAAHHKIEHLNNIMQAFSSDCHGQHENEEDCY
jgi:hypothetical protein